MVTNNSNQLNSATKLPVTGVVLCGGRATRMQGKDKGLIEFAGKPMVQYAIDALKDCDEIIINANRNQTEYQMLTQLPVQSDSIDGFAGPLAGIHSAMQAAQHEWLISCPCDCPFIDNDYVLTMRQACQEDKEKHLIFIAHDEFRQPVFTLIHTSLKDKLAAFLNTNTHKKILLFYQQIGYSTVYFPSGERFTNINYPTELQ